MEEADALADRVGIMYAGSIRCYGSAMFLKRALGTGYQIRIAKAKDILCDSVNMPIRQYFPNAVLLENMDAEVHYALNSKNEERFAKSRSKSSDSEFESRRLMSIDSSMNLSDSSLFRTSLFHQYGLNNRAIKRQVSEFVSFFEYLEKNRSKLGITSWGLSISTMEDVFLKIELLATSGVKPSVFRGLLDPGQK